MNIFIVDSEQPTRLDVWLSGKLGKSRSQIQKLIKSGAVLVNGKVKTPHEELRNGDEVQVIKSESQEVTKTQKRKNTKTQNHNSSRPPLTLRGGVNGIASSQTPRNDIRIIFECPDYIIVEKPEGVVVHHDAKHKSGTLVDWVLEKYPEINTVGDPERPGVVHRLDKEVSGLLVVARNQNFYDHIKKQFDERTVAKEYAALVFGEILNSSGTILFKLVRSKHQEKYIGLSPTSEDLDAKDAETGYEVAAADQHYSLVKLFPKTGRTHQLRVHLRTFGHPIVGDRLYELPAFRHLNRKFSRVMLHARRITFQNLSRESVLYESVIPSEMAETIEDIFHVNNF